MPSRLADIRDGLFVALAGVAGAVLATGAPFLGVPLLAAALGWVALRHGMLPSMVAAFVVAALGVLVNGSLESAAFIVPAALVAGPGTAWALGRWSAVRVIAGVTVVLLVAAIGLDALTAASEGMTVVAAQAKQAEIMRQLVLKSAEQSGGADPKAAADLADQFAMIWRTLWPSMYLYMTGLAAVIAVPIVSRTGRALGKPVSSLPPLAELDLTPHIVWPTIAGLGLLAAAAYLRQADGWMQAVGANLLLVVRPVLFFQGAGCFAALYNKAGVSKVGRGFGYAFLTFTESLVPSVSVIGLVDLFANLRKLPRKGVTAPAGGTRA